MILGIGTDIVSIGRFKPWLENPALMRRYFSLPEIDWCVSRDDHAAASLAARFAAKEAFGKALGTGLKGIVLRDVCVNRDEAGKPFLTLGKSAIARLEKLLGKAGKDWKTHLSLSHDGGSALAFVVIESVAKESSVFAMRKTPVQSHAKRVMEE